MIRIMAPEHIPSLRGRATIITVISVVVLIALCLLVWAYRNTPPLSNLLGSGHATSTGQLQATASYLCNEGKNITAKYYDGPSSTAPNGMPIPGGSVELKLSDGRTMSVPHAVSADGARYANADETFVFWSKGNTAFIQENAENNLTYTGCIAEAARTADQQNWTAYASSMMGFSILYPSSYTADDSYTYQAMGPGKDINGVKFTIPASMAAGTNLSSDSYVSVEVKPNIQNCSADLFLDSPQKVSNVTDGTVEYSMAQGGGVGAGNLYDETVYAIPGSNPCTAVRYFVHSTQLGNYPAGTRTAFDKDALLAQFDQIRHSLTLGR
jgi:membrane-bound inhibitor of C-type lysozyme